MKAVAHPVACSHLPLSGHMDRIKALPPSSTKTFLPPSRHRERITHRSMKTLAAVDDNNRVSPPTPAGYDKWPPMGSFEEYLEYLEKNNIQMPHIPASGNSTFKDLRYSEFLEFPEKFQTNDFCDPRDFEKERRRARQDDAKRFRRCYTYGIVKEGCNNSMEQKTCIWPGDTLSWQDESSGITWVGVHGMDSICVVARNEDPDVTRLCDILKRMPIHNVPFSFRKSVIVEIEDLADPSSKIRERFPKRIEKPFGVVSAIPDPYKSHKGSGHEASSVEYDETKAIEFLQEKVKSDRVFTVTETIQTAIAAFEQLFQKKFKADEIKVSLLDPNYVVYADSNGKDPSVQDFTDRQINEHLAVINNPGPPKTQVPDSRRINGHSALINKPGAKDSSSDSWRLREQQRRQSTV